jgi:glyoxylase-like metal-dependent hydrolase (beta-lactamase superfamily II)
LSSNIGPGESAHDKRHARLFQPEISTTLGAQRRFRACELTRLAHSASFGAIVDVAKNEGERTMRARYKKPLAVCGLCAGLVLSACAPGGEDVEPSSFPLVASGQTQALSEHAYVILDNDVRFVPNVGIVVGDRATLIVDTGVGERNGAVILEEARKLSDNELFYVTSTHYHTEHELGAGAFPDTAQVIRSHATQRDVEAFGAAHVNRFRDLTPDLAELLEGSDQFRDADILFDREHVLYLGGVSVRMLHVGPAHTAGDTVFFVEGEGVLYAGDVAMQRYPGIRTGDYSIAGWRDALATAAALEPQFVVPSHGPMGGAELIAAYDGFFATLQTQAAELKAQGRTADQVADELMQELGPSFPDWDPEDVVLLGNAARYAFMEAP